MENRTLQWGFPLACFPMIFSEGWCCLTDRCQDHGARLSASGTLTPPYQNTTGWARSNRRANCKLVTRGWRKNWKLKQKDSWKVYLVPAEGTVCARLVATRLEMSSGGSQSIHCRLWKQSKMKLQHNSIICDTLSRHHVGLWLNWVEN